MNVPRPLLTAAIAVGAVVDATVATLALFLQPLLGPLFDVPVIDPALTTIVGGEYVIVTLLYVLLLRDLERYRILLYFIALDQFFAALLPGIEIARHHVVATWKTLGPIPLNLLLALTYFLGARLGTDSRRDSFRRRYTR